ncbi:hypothetical protein N0O92_13075 [Alkalihalobacillus sp. MEB130]|nr:hypothetical protein [Alkalihalobacillus sp. MEB130]MDT8861167.1 hypothetical protein [Alkalihalobacillus sp. MEB130]
MMFWIRLMTIAVLSASAFSIFLYQGIEFTQAMFDLWKNKA